MSLISRTELIKLFPDLAGAIPDHSGYVPRSYPSDRPWHYILEYAVNVKHFSTALILVEKYVPNNELDKSLRLCIQRGRNHNSDGKDRLDLIKKLIEK
jgi:hypothetical protein